MPHQLLYNEQELLLQVSGGNEKAFATLFNRYYSWLRPFIARFSLTEADIEETLQETFIRVWLYRDKLPEVKNLRGWIFRVASREALNTLRKNLHDRKKMVLVQQLYENGAPELTPADQVHFSEITQLVQEAVNQMPAKRKLVYRMSRDRGMKPAEIAATLAISVNTVKNMLVTALKDIREYLAKAGHPLLFIYIFCRIF